MFAALQTYAQPYILNQRNKIISKAKSMQERYRVAVSLPSPSDPAPSRAV